MDEEEEKEIERKEAEKRAAEEKEKAAADSDVRKSAREKRIDDVLEETKKATEELKKQNEEKREIMKAEKEIADKKALGGQTEAGIAPVEKSEDEKWAKGAKERYEGTGLNPTNEEW